MSIRVSVLGKNGGNLRKFASGEALLECETKATEIIEEKKLSVNESTIEY